MSAGHQSRDREGVVEFLLRPVHFQVGSTIPVLDPWPADSVTRPPAAAARPRAGAWGSEQSWPIASPPLFNGPRDEDLHMPPMVSRTLRHEVWERRMTVMDE